MTRRPGKRAGALALWRAGVGAGAAHCAQRTCPAFPLSGEARRTFITTNAVVPRAATVCARPSAASVCPSRRGCNGHWLCSHIGLRPGAPQRPAPARLDGVELRRISLESKTEPVAGAQAGPRALLPLPACYSQCSSLGRTLFITHPTACAAHACMLAQLHTSGPAPPANFRRRAEMVFSSSPVSPSWLAE